MAEQIYEQIVKDLETAKSIKIKADKLGFYRDEYKIKLIDYERQIRHLKRERKTSFKLMHRKITRIINKKKRTLRKLRKRHILFLRAWACTSDVYYSLKNGIEDMKTAYRNAGGTLSFP